MEDSYLEEYRQDTDMRVDRDPQQAVGGMWDEIGKLQFDFLVMKGLKPEHSMLDLGCGTLRGGIRFIDYLKTGNYYGLDISYKAIEYAKTYLKGCFLEDKNPKLAVNEDLRFSRMRKKFDYILAQSVFTHLPLKNVQECFEHIGKILKDDGKFYFTFRRKKNKHRDGINFFYDYNVFGVLAQEYGFNIRICPKYNHPRKQIMVECVKI